MTGCAGPSLNQGAESAICCLLTLLVVANARKRRGNIRQCVCAKDQRAADVERHKRAGARPGEMNDT